MCKPMPSENPKVAYVATQIKGFQVSMACLHCWAVAGNAGSIGWKTRGTGLAHLAKSITRLQWLQVVQDKSLWKKNNWGVSGSCKLQETKISMSEG